MPALKSVDWEAVGMTVVERAALILLVVIVGFVGLRIARWAIDRAVETALDREADDSTTAELSAVERRKRIETLQGFFLKVARLVAAVIVLLVLLAAFDMLAVVASLSLLGAALAFAGQNVIRDYVNGAYILLENQFAVGDVVRVAGVAGTVEDLSLRRTTLRDLDGVVHVVPNGSITVASNMTRTWARVNEDILVGYGTDIDRAIAVVDEVGVAMAAEPVWRRRILEAPKVLRVQALSEYGVTLKVLGTVRAADQWEAAGGAAATRARGLPRPRDRDPLPDPRRRQPRGSGVLARRRVTGRGVGPRSTRHRQVTARPGARMAADTVRSIPGR